MLSKARVEQPGKRYEDEIAGVRRDRAHDTEEDHGKAEPALRDVGRRSLDQRTQQADMLCHADAHHDEQDDADDPAAESQPVRQYRVVENPADILGVVHWPDRLQYRLAARSLDLEAIASQNHRGGEHHQPQQHEQNDGIRDCLARALYPADRPRTAFLNVCHLRPRTKNSAAYVAQLTPACNRLEHGPGNVHSDQRGVFA